MKMHRLVALSTLVVLAGWQATAAAQAPAKKSEGDKKPAAEAKAPAKAEATEKKPAAEKKAAESKPATELKPAAQPTPAPAKPSAPAAAAETKSAPTPAPQPAAAPTPAAAPVENDAVVPVPRDGGWMQRHELINSRAVPGEVDVIFLGDSITQGWEGAGKDAWEKHFAPLKAMNAGIGGDRTQHVLWRLENGNIKGITPRVAVIMIGTNNSGANTSEQIAAGNKAIVEKLRKELPQTKILLLAIFPRGADANDPRRQVNEGANKIIKNLADDQSVYFLDIGSKFLEKDGTLSKEVMPDLLHLNPASYETWAVAIEPKVKELLNSAGGVAGSGTVRYNNGGRRPGVLRRILSR